MTSTSHGASVINYSRDGSQPSKARGSRERAKAANEPYRKKARSCSKTDVSGAWCTRMAPRANKIPDSKAFRSPSLLFP